MNTRWLIPLLALIAAAVVAYAVARRTACCPRSPAPEAWQDVSHLEHELRLTDAQAGRARRLHAEFCARLTECCARHCAARALLTEALPLGTNAEATADAIISDMTRAYRDSERATVDHLREMRAMLTPEQSRRFDALVAEQIGKTCSMPGSRPSGKACGP